MPYPWDGDDVEIVPADESCDVAMAESQLWASVEAGCFSGRQKVDWDFVDAAKNRTTPVLTAGENL